MQLAANAKIDNRFLKWGIKCNTYSDWKETQQIGIEGKFSNLINGHLQIELILYLVLK